MYVVVAKQLRTKFTSIMDDQPDIWFIYPHTKCHCCYYALKIEQIIWSHIIIANKLH